MPAVRGPAQHLVGLHPPMGDEEAQGQETSCGVGGGAGDLQKGPSFHLQVQEVWQPFRLQSGGEQAPEEFALS